MVSLTLLENTTGSTNRQLASLLQKLTDFFTTKLGTLIRCDLLHCFVDFIEIGHLCLDSNLLDSTPMAAPE